MNHEPKKNFSIRLSPEMVEWLTRHGNPVGTQIKDDLGLLRLLLKMSETEAGDRLCLAEALNEARSLREW